MRTDCFFFWGIEKGYDEDANWKEILERLEALSSKFDDGDKEVVEESGEAEDKR